MQSTYIINVSLIKFHLIRDIYKICSLQEYILFEPGKNNNNISISVTRKKNIYILLSVYSNIK